MSDLLDKPGLAGRIRAACRRLAESLTRSIARLRSGYRPERHYMRGSHTGAASPKPGSR